MTELTGPASRRCHRAEHEGVVTAYLKQALDECLARRCRRVPIEERPEGPRLDTLSVFQIVSQGSGPAAGHFSAIAYVDVNAEGNLMKFAEDIAVNRTLHLVHCGSTRENSG